MDVPSLEFLTLDCGGVGDGGVCGQDGLGDDVGTCDEHDSDIVDVGCGVGDGSGHGGYLGDDGGSVVPSDEDLTLDGCKRGDGDCGSIGGGDDGQGGSVGGLECDGIGDVVKLCVDGRGGRSLGGCGDGHGITGDIGPSDELLSDGNGRIECGWCLKCNGCGRLHGICLDDVGGACDDIGNGHGDGCRHGFALALGIGNGCDEREGADGHGKYRERVEFG